MELVYIYIHQSKLYQAEQHINLDPLYTYRFYRDGNQFKIDRKRTNVHFNVMQANDIVSNMTAIVGRNGVGKSNLFRLLTQVFQNESINLHEEMYVLFRDSEDCYWLYIWQPERDQEVYLLEVREETLLQNSELPAGKHPIKLRVYAFHPKAHFQRKYVQNNYTHNCIDCTIYREEGASFKKIVDYLQSQLQQQDREMFKHPPYSADIYYSRNWLNRLADTWEMDAIVEGEPTSFFDLKLKEHTDHSMKGVFIQHIDESQPIRFKFLSEVAEWYEVDAFHAFVAEYFGSIYRMITNQEHKENYAKNLQEHLKKYEKKDEKPQTLGEVISILWETADTLIDGLNMKKFNEKSKNEYVKCVEKILKPYQTILNIELNKERGTVVVDLHKALGEDIQKLIASVHSDENCENYQMLTDFISYSLKFLSDGEISYLHYFSILHEVLDSSILDIYNEKYSVLLLLDEPDRRMHPEMSRRFVKLLTDFLKEYSNSNIDKIQVMVTTHSPFVVTDFPKEHVLYMKRESDGTLIESPQHETFGTNIHHLLIDDFYMEQTIGEYARVQLAEVLKCLQEGCTKWSDQQLQQMIYSVGDYIVRQQLQRMYDQRFLQVEDVKRQIERLKSKLKELEGDS